MAENDIYNSRKKYERFVSKIGEMARPPEDRGITQGRNGAKYYCKNPANLEYFRALHRAFEARDLSYIRRLRLLNVLKIVCFVTDKNLAECEREDINGIMAYTHRVLLSPKSKQDFVRDIKYIWKIILPELDERGRVDDTISPYAVRHLSARVDRSREKTREDRLTVEEYGKYLRAFSQDARIQAFIAAIYDGLARPQELCYVRINDVELYDNYAIIQISEHGKEGPGSVLCIESFPYIAAWYNQHPLRHDPEAFFFINLSVNGRYKQLKPSAINKHLKEKSRLLGIRKRITCYSFKRNGVTLMRARGDSELEIQHRARWRSLKPLKSYDMNQREDAIRITLAKRGLITEDRFQESQPLSKKCLYCECVNGIADDICSRCKRPLDRERIRKQVEESLSGKRKADNVMARLLEDKSVQELLVQKIREMGLAGEVLEKVT